MERLFILSLHRLVEKMVAEGKLSSKPRIAEDTENRCVSVMTTDATAQDEISTMAVEAKYKHVVKPHVITINF